MQRFNRYLHFVCYKTTDKSPGIWFKLLLCRCSIHFKFAFAQAFLNHNFFFLFSQLQSAVMMNLATLRLDSLFDYSGELRDKPGRQVVDKHFCRLRRVVQPDLERVNLRRFKAGHLTYPYFLPRWLPNSIQTWEERGNSHQTLDFVSHIFQVVDLWWFLRVASYRKINCGRITLINLTQECFSSLHVLNAINKRAN